MSKDGPTDCRIPGGRLLYHPQRDAHFPYLYEVATHALVHAPQYLKKIWIHVVDTSTDARIEGAKFAKTLSVPLGPNANMEKYGPSDNLTSETF